jgi:TonB family protein
VAADCALIKSKALPKSGDFKFQTVWPDLPFENDAVYPVPPRSKGALHVCLKDYPPRAVREGRYGTTELLFEITAAGTVDWVIVAASSGHADLDQASAHCATAWQYEPAQSAGNPIEVPWDAQVAWALDDSGRAHSPMFRMPVVNCIKDHSDAKERASTLSGGVTVVGYKLVNGEVSETFAVLGSGDTALDAYAFSCVRSWRFKPYYDDGTPATGTHAAIIDWTGRKF